MTREERKLAIEELQGCIIAEEHGKDGKPNGNVTCELTRDTIDLAIKALEQEPTTKNDLGVDCISKQAVIRTIYDNKSDFKNDFAQGFFADKIRELPSVTPQEPKTGHWIYDDIVNNWRCDKCGETPKTMGYVGSDKFMAEHFKFCNNCGAKMVEPQESEANRSEEE